VNSPIAPRTGSVHDETWPDRTGSTSKSVDAASDCRHSVCLNLQTIFNIRYVAVDSSKSGAGLHNRGLARRNSYTTLRKEFARNPAANAPHEDFESASTLIKSQNGKAATVLECSIGTFCDAGS
jgi:hypothetical protein